MANSNKKKQSAPAPAKKKTKPAKEQEAPKSEPKVRDENSMLHRILPGVFVVCAILLGVCFIFHDGAVGKVIYDVFFGLFGLVSLLVPLLLIYFAAYWRKWVADGQHVIKCIFAVICLFFVGSLLQVILIAATGGDTSDYACIKCLWENGVNFSGAGFVFGIIGIGLYKAFAAAAGIILSAAGLLVFSFFLFGISPKDIWINIKYNAKINAERRKAAKEREEALAAQAEAEETEFYEEEEETPAPKKNNKSEKFETAVPKPDFDMNFSEGEFEDEPPVVEEAVAPETADDVFEDDGEEPEAGGEPIDTSKIPPLYNEKGEIDLRAIFVEEYAESEADEAEEFFDEGVEISEKTVADEDILPVSKTDMSETDELIEKPKAAPAQKPEYRFPPITLLAPPEKKKNEDVGAELRANATKLVETLRSFKVNVTISSVSRGPTITRYELIPEAGTRVRSIANLVDDISLSLATSGIRIEAPIPGKAAVGIEVPNRTVSTVTLRELIENSAFTDAKSKLTVCLGKDVGGSPIMFDIAKMPHLLIAGATGMGKSVCINSIITSILYKAKPDEVKLILIDPKKVEFNIYNGIPHLQIPVVSDPKKAAGALHWAVTEMERRYELIEEANTRKIEPYNEVARKRGMEVLPYTVIIIDELADLMMTAPDAVEDSICRLAQKARAAGMHIIIGTQRPSVDVITGLIKANIPSRIAFTVASQVDSRTIIDIAGAEKLIGRGDMLYYPVGLAKPMRAQGAFVSEDEVEKITDFVKANVGENEYDADIMERIEREAQAIGQSQKKGGGDGGDLDEGASDPKLRDALEIATDIGKISTSLLQRKLSIGYGRAAKIIDIMEARGFVSAPDGQKPREVLISKTQFREMVVNNDPKLA
ncbi:MAG: DNA translocase FtsK [Ruminococcaceae bacterium]|nr:DNA translocase FtsK [Oscillospiraceae bacterium]